MSKLKDLLAQKGKLGGEQVATQPAPTAKLNFKPATPPVNNVPAKKISGLTLRNPQPIEARPLPTDAMDELASTENGGKLEPVRLSESTMQIPTQKPQLSVLKVTDDITEWREDIAQRALYTPDIAAELKSHLDALSEVLNSDDVSDALNRCLNFIADNPNTKEFLLPEDVGVLLRALATSESIVIAQKEKNSGRRKQRQDAVAKAADDLASLGF